MRQGCRIVHDQLGVQCSSGTSLPLVHFLPPIYAACFVQVRHFLNSTFIFRLILSLPPICCLSARVRESDRCCSGWNGYRGVCAHAGRGGLLWSLSIHSALFSEYLRPKRRLVPRFLLVRSAGDRLACYSVHSLRSCLCHQKNTENKVQRIESQILPVVLWGF